MTTTDARTPPMLVKVLLSATVAAITSIIYLQRQARFFNAGNTAWIENMNPMQKNATVNEQPHKPIQITTLTEARMHKVAPVSNRSIDTSQYTIRMNTWHRNEQLLISLNHHAMCEGVAVIQVIWCDKMNGPPEEVLRHKSGKVQIERHGINSLNERFRIVIQTPTLGILSIDDDILRPCEALDAAFIRWTRHPSRLVGFDARSHRIDSKMINPKNVSESSAAAWEYGMVGKSNLYSMTLTKTCFVHRDYLDIYTMALPRPIYHHIDKHFECEDIAMSFLVSTLTEGKPPLLSDAWADTYIQLYTRNNISWKGEHLAARSICVKEFGEYLRLRDSKGEISNKSGVDVQPLKSGILMHNSFFRRGDDPENWSSIDPLSFHASRLQHLVKELQWRESLGGQDAVKNSEWVVEMRTKMESKARNSGLVKGTPEWKLRWLFNCATELNLDKETKDCFASKKLSFVCDITDGVLHHVSGSAVWLHAGPPKGTGTHEYAAYQGQAPCSKNGYCPGCMSPNGEAICSVKIDPEDCSIDVGNETKQTIGR